MRRLHLLALSTLLLGLPGCDSLPGVGDDGGFQGTQCIYSYSLDGAGSELGESCDADAECGTGVCMQPGDSGNITNNTFGFCTRGCDCDDSEAAKIPTEDKEILECLYPPGNQGVDHHVVIECLTLSDCTDIDPAWTDCATSSGTARKVCQAL